ncbi:MAG: signal peptidase I, partial [Parachlamydiaceae bacterium]
WIPEDVSAQSVPHDSLKAYSDFFGIRNFAMARLLTPQELQQIEGIDSKDVPKGVLYLELSHHPSLTYPTPTVWQSSRHPILLSSLKTVIPLNQEQLDRLMDHMYTARLVFKNGRATRYSVEAPYFDIESPAFPGVPDGTYEFYDGKLVTVGWGAITHAVDRDHPLYSHDPKNIQKLFNFGIEMHGSYGPDSQNQWNIPSRYVYFRDGDLYALGAPFLKKEDPALKAFNSREENKEKNASKDRPYAAFKDYGAPIKNGEYDVQSIRTFGVTVPDKRYLVLGDNHAMSADSRDWGFVPEDNLQGAPSLILWPPGERLGIPWQAPYAFFTLPRLIVWSIAAITAGIWGFLHRRYLHRRIVLKKPLA